MTPKAVEAFERLIGMAISPTEPAATREAAIAAGGLPVYSDMSAVLVITAEGSVLHYDPERKLVSPVTEDRWRTAALLKAARKHVELAELLPPRPEAALTCAQCAGSGSVGTIDCGQCMGAGWVSPA